MANPPTTADISNPSAPSRPDITWDQTAARVYADAIAGGLNAEGARVAVAIARTEGGYTGKGGDDAQSFGVFQFYGGGGMLNEFAKGLGKTLAQVTAMLRADPFAGNDWALNRGGYLGQAIREGQNNGYHGAQLAEYAQHWGQRSVTPERAAAWYINLFGAGDSTTQPIDGPGPAPPPGVEPDPKIPGQPDAEPGALPKTDDPNAVPAEVPAEKPAVDSSSIPGAIAAVASAIYSFGASIKSATDFFTGLDTTWKGLEITLWQLLATIIAGIIILVGLFRLTGVDAGTAVKAAAL